MTAIASTPAPVASLFAWWREGSAAGRKALVAASMGWALDAFDVMLFSLTLASVIADLGLTKTQAGALGSVTLLGGAAGGLIFGHIADRFGRTRALMASVLIYSVFTARAVSRRTSGSSRSFARCSGSAWAASGRAARRSSPRHGRRDFADARSASCRARGRSGLPRRRWSSASSAALRMARRVLRRRAARVVHVLGAAAMSKSPRSGWSERAQTSPPRNASGVIPSGGRRPESRNLHVRFPASSGARCCG